MTTFAVTEGEGSPSLFPLNAPLPSHPAKYTDALLLAMARMLQGRRRILDPFGGVGGVFKLEHWLPDAEFQSVEIEPEWAAKHPKMTLGNALHLPWEDGYFDAICTSPTYGNRMGDATLNTPLSSRIAYTANMGRKLHPDNAGALQWGHKYRDFHQLAWTEARRVLSAGGVFVLNIKDHIRKGQVQPVTQWHIHTLCALGFALVGHEQIETPSFMRGSNRELRVAYENVALLQLEHKP